LLRFVLSSLLGETPPLSSLLPFVARRSLLKIPGRGRDVTPTFFSWFSFFGFRFFFALLSGVFRDAYVSNTRG